MARLSANLGFLFTERPHLERPAAAAAAGFRAVELQFPYEALAPAMRAALDVAGVRMLALNTPLGEGEAAHGLGALRGREAEFQTGVDRALAYAEVIGATGLHCMAGCVPAEEVTSCEEIFAQNLRLAADRAAHLGITLLIEPINHRDRPGYALARVEQAASIIERAGRANLRIMFDCYHVQIMQGDLIRRLEAHLPLVGHVQIAAVPSPLRASSTMPRSCAPSTAWAMTAGSGPSTALAAAPRTASAGWVPSATRERADGSPYRRTMNASATRRSSQPSRSSAGASSSAAGRPRHR